MLYFYDRQVSRHLAQFIRIFSDISVRSEPNSNGYQLEMKVPVKYGDMTRMAASIMSQNTENVTISAPSIACYITALTPSKDRRASPMMTTKVQAEEQKFNSLTGEYSDTVGNKYTVERYMPIPYDMSMQVDILTTNTDTKLQIFEQISTIFNPSIQLQQNENPLDWTSVFEVILTDTTWSNRSIPMNTETTYDMMSFKFTMEIWINPPAKEKRQRIIEKIIARVYKDDCHLDSENPFDLSKQIAQVNATFENLKIKVEEDLNPLYHRVTLLNQYGIEDPAITWESKIGTFGTIEPNISRIKLKTNDDIESDEGDIYAIVQSIDINPSVLIVSIDPDTLPNTITDSPINSIIDPTLQYPGVNLPIKAAGQKYLLIRNNSNDDPAITPANTYWEGLTAYENDIIFYTGSQWIVIFDGQNENPSQYVKNLDDKQHYRFIGTEWIYTFIGTYNPVYWAIENLNPIQ